MELPKVGHNACSFAPVNLPICMNGEGIYATTPFPFCWETLHSLSHISRPYPCSGSVPSTALPRNMEQLARLQDSINLGQTSPPSG